MFRVTFFRRLCEELLLDPGSLGSRVSTAACSCDVRIERALCCLQVRVGAVVFSTRSYVDIKLDAFSSKKRLTAALDGIDYRRGWTYTNKALDMLRTDVLTDENTRPGVPQ